MTRILIIELSNSGHHPSYLRHILQSIPAGAGEVVVAGTPELLAHDELDSFQGHFTPLVIHLSRNEQASLLNFSPLGLIRRELCVRRIYARTWRHASDASAVDTIILPFVDECLNALALLGAPFGRTSWIGITMRTQFHLSRMGVIAPAPFARPLREWLFRRMLKQQTLVKLLSIDPTLVEFARHQNGSEFSKIHYLPDPSEVLPPLSKERARESLNIPKDCKLVLLYGALSVRKGITQLIRAMSRSDCPESVHLLLAGTPDDRVKNILESGPAASLIGSNRLHIVSGYIPEGRVAELVYSSDVVWIGYLEFYTMSSVLVLASRHMLPCITSRDGIIGYLSRTHGFGMTVDPRSEQSIVDVLQRIGRGDASVAGAAVRASAVFALHTYREFYRIIFESVQSAGRKATPTG
jgi:hypothetical protein